MRVLQTQVNFSRWVWSGRLNADGTVSFWVSLEGIEDFPFDPVCESDADCVFDFGYGYTFSGICGYDGYCYVDWIDMEGEDIST